MSVDRCVCNNVTFVSLKQLARSEKLDFRGLVERTGCSSVCALCGPFIELMLKTGETSFDPDDPRVHDPRPGCGAITEEELNAEDPENTE